MAELGGEIGAQIGAQIGAELGRRLVELAREAIARYLQRGERIEAPGDPPHLLEARGVFVSLHQDGELRGCIGYPTPSLPLGQAVITAAIDAATADPRFPAVPAAELGALAVEVSVLSPAEVCRAEEVTVGLHGVIVSQAGRRGLLLPQVAAEHGWDRETLLAQGCRKAGLPADAWRQGARIERFTAEVFGER